MEYEQIEKAYTEWSEDKSNSHTEAFLEFSDDDVKSARAIFTDGFMACLSILKIEVK
jgi:hypothetical protein